jgi:hypothetical protein
MKELLFFVLLAMAAATDVDGESPSLQPEFLEIDDSLGDNHGFGKVMLCFAVMLLSLKLCSRFRTLLSVLWQMLMGTTSLFSLL